MDLSPCLPALEIGDETEPTAIPGTEGIHTMRTKSVTDKSRKASDVRFSWIDGEGAGEHAWYHWLADCPRLMADLWYGGRLVTSEAPPPGASDAAYWREDLEKHLQGPAWDPESVDSPPDEPRPDWWLCSLCREYFPEAEAKARRAEDDSCEKCGCSREMHTRLRGPLPTYCVMAWADVLRDEDGEVLAYDLIHCPCDDYAPPAGGRTLTPSDFAADGL
jgi:hypothetical protein